MTKGFNIDEAEELANQIEICCIDDWEPTLEFALTWSATIRDACARIRNLELLISSALCGPDDEFCGPDYPELRELHAALR